MDKELFRQEAIDRIESPERLNEIIRITSARDWMIVYTLIGLFVSVFLWSIFGQLPSYVNGQGILLQTGGINEVSAISQGKIIETLFEEGTFVKTNDIIAYVDQPELQLKIVNEISKKNDFNNSYNRIKTFGGENLKQKKLLFEKEKLSKLNSIESNEKRIAFINERIKAQEELVSKGLITAETLNATKNSYFNVQQENESLKNELKRINLNIFQVEEENEIELQKLRSEMLLIDNRIHELNSLMQLSSAIKSPCNGKVIELMVRPGSVIYPGGPIARIEPTEVDELVQAIIYVNPRDGKKIKTGMSVKISPSTVEVEEYGYILGVVEKVSDYPATHDGMLRTLGNKELVSSFSNLEPPIAIMVRLEKDSATFSGYKWTSMMGPKLEIRTGTMCTSKVVVETKHPISLLIPPKIGNPVIQKLKQTIQKKTSNSEVVKTSVDNHNHEAIIKIDTIFPVINQKSDTTSNITYYAIQILAARNEVKPDKLIFIYNGKEDIFKKIENNLNKYYIGKFESKELAYKYIHDNSLSSDFFVIPISY